MPKVQDKIMLLLDGGMTAPNEGESLVTAVHLHSSSVKLHNFPILLGYSEDTKQYRTAAVGLNQLLGEAVAVFSLYRRKDADRAKFVLASSSHLLFCRITAGRGTLQVSVKYSVGIRPNELIMSWIAEETNQRHLISELDFIKFDMFETLRILPDTVLTLSTPLSINFVGSAVAIPSKKPRIYPGDTYQLRIQSLTFLELLFRLSNYDSEI